MPAIVDKAMCNACEECVESCPTEVISMVDGKAFVNAEECIDCGACEPECPVEAIFSEEELPAAQQPFLQINAELAKKWPVITQRGEPPADADEHKDETGKFDKYFTPNPGEA